MNTLISLHNAVFDRIDRWGDWLLPTLARFVFAAILLFYFWKSALTKIGDGFFGFLFPSDGAYVQMFPAAMEAVSYDSSQLGFYYWLVALLGTWGEFVLPALILVGLLTRLAAVGMIIFVIVQTATDVYLHGASDPKSFGGWFNSVPDSVIADQRLLWVTVLLIIVIKGAGPLSLDRLIGRLS